MATRGSSSLTREGGGDGCGGDDGANGSGEGNRGDRGAGGGLGVFVAGAENGAACDGTSRCRTGLVVKLMPFYLNPN